MLYLWNVFYEMSSERHFINGHLIDNQNYCRFSNFKRAEFSQFHSFSSTEKPELKIIDFKTVLQENLCNFCSEKCLNFNVLT